MSNRKTIQINPELFSMSPKKKGRPLTPKNKGGKKTPMLRPNSLKKKLIQRVKEHKLKEGPYNTTGMTSIHTPSINEGDNYIEEFSDSIQYLSQLSNQSKEASKRVRSKSTTLKNYDSSAFTTPHVEVDLPEELRTVPPVPYIPENEPAIQLSAPSTRPGDVPYGCLKGGSKPTFKSWTKTQKHHSPIQQSAPSLNLSSIDTMANHEPSSLREQKLVDLKNRLKQKSHVYSDNVVSETIPMIATPLISTLSHNPFPPQPITSNESNVAGSRQKSSEVVNITEPAVPKKTKTTTKRTYTLGKNTKKRSVGILIKDRKTRKRVLDAHRGLKRKPITDVKQHLRDQGLIKAGSKAPNDILRKMYESSMLSGDIVNQDSGVLMHNFLNDHD